MVKGEEALDVPKVNLLFGKTLKFFWSDGKEGTNIVMVSGQNAL